MLVIKSYWPVNRETVSVEVPYYRVFYDTGIYEIGIEHADILDRTIIVMFSGKIGSGKTTIADEFVRFMNSRYRGEVVAKKFSFGKYVKQIDGLIGWSGEKDEKGRELLQYIGHMGRHYTNGKLWVQLVAGDIISEAERLDTERKDLYLIAVIDDFRYPSEFFELNKAFPSIYTVKVYGPVPEDQLDNSKERQHPSENSLDSWCLWNAYIYNDFDIKNNYQRESIMAGLGRMVMTVKEYDNEQRVEEDY